MSDIKPCQHRHGVGGACIHCGFKHPDHDELVARLRREFLTALEAYAFASDNPLVLDQYMEVDRGERIKWGFATPGKFDEVCDRIVPDRSRRWEFVVEFFRIFVGDLKSEQEVQAFAVDYVAYTIEHNARTELRNFPEAQKQGLAEAASLRRGERIKRSIMVSDALAAALQSVYRSGAHNHTTGFAEKLFLPD